MAGLHSGVRHSPESVGEPISFTVDRFASTPDRDVHGSRPRGDNGTLTPGEPTS
jgi:hypothetical protein